MPVSCDSATLISDARCVDSCIPEGMQLSVLISIFCQIADMDCTPSTLINGARCFDSCIPPGMRMSVLVSLACQILQGGGGGGGSPPQVFSGHYGGVMPATPIPDPTVTAALNFDLDAPFQMWRWDAVALNWGG